MDITVNELKERLDKGTAPKLIDVREEYEFDNQHLDAEHIPLGEIPGKVEALAELKDLEFVVYCRSGGRSGRAAEFLRGQGFSKVRNLTGGMLAWKMYIDPSFNVQ